MTQDVVVGAVRHGTRFWFMQRHDGCWTFPSGKVQEGESLDAALRREIFEETGMEIASAAFLGKRTLDDVTLHYFACETDRASAEIREPDKFSHGAWMSGLQILSLAGAQVFGPVRNFLLMTRTSGVHPC